MRFTVMPRGWVEVVRVTLAPPAPGSEDVREEPGRLVAEPPQAADREHVVERDLMAVLHVGRERGGALLREVLVEHPAHELLMELEAALVHVHPVSYTHLRAHE